MARITAHALLQIHFAVLNSFVPGYILDKLRRGVDDHQDAQHHSYASGPLDGDDVREAPRLVASEYDKDTDCDIYERREERHGLARVFNALRYFS